MTREMFRKRAIREAEHRLGVPPGWWGAYRHVYGPRGLSVKYAIGGVWSLCRNGKLISRHDSRAFAIKKAAALAPRRSR